MSEYRFFKPQKQRNFYVHIQKNVEIQHAVEIVLN